MKQILNHLKSIILSAALMLSVFQNIPAQAAKYVSQKTMTFTVKHSLDNLGCIDKETFLLLTGKHIDPYTNPSEYEEYLVTAKIIRMKGKAKPWEQGKRGKKEYLFYKIDCVENIGAFFKVKIADFKPGLSLKPRMSLYGSGRIELFNPYGVKSCTYKITINNKKGKKTIRNIKKTDNLKKANAFINKLYGKNMF